MQNINFYNLLTLPEKSSKELNKLWLIAGGFLTVLILHTLFIVAKNVSLSKKIENTSKTLAAQTISINQISAENPFLNIGDLSNSVANMEKDLDIQNKIFFALSRKFRFSDALKTLGITITPHVWLTKIMIGEDGQSLSLEGQALEMADLHLFLEKLLKQPIFKQHHLKIQEIKKEIPNDNLASEILVFNIGNKLVNANEH